MDIDLNKVISSQTHSPSGHDGELTAVEREVVNRFFQSLTLLYGSPKMKATWPTPELKLGAKKIWAEKIIRLGWQELNKRLEYAQSQMHMKEWEWPNIALILRGEQQPGAGGLAAQSYRDASDVLALPSRKSDRTASQAALDTLRADLDVSLQEKDKAATEQHRAERAELRRLENKHVPFGYYLRETESGDYVPATIRHSFNNIEHGNHTLGEEKGWMYEKQT